MTYSVPCYHTPRRPQEFPTYDYDTVLFVVLTEFFSFGVPLSVALALFQGFEILGKFLLEQAESFVILVSITGAVPGLTEATVLALSQIPFARNILVQSQGHHGVAKR